MCNRANKIGISLVVFVLIAVFSQLAHAEERVDLGTVGPVISIARGDVQVKVYGSSTWDPAEEGFVLGAGDMVRTGDGSRTEVQHYSGTIRLHENTVLTVPSILSRNGNRDLGEIVLENGTGLFRLDSERLKGGFKVRTRHVIAGVKGTTFSVRTDELSSKVAVYDGAVEVRETGRTKGSREVVNKGRSVQALTGKGLSQVEKFKRRDDWNGWKKGLTPQLSKTSSDRRISSETSSDRGVISETPSDEAVKDDGKKNLPDKGIKNDRSQPAEPESKDKTKNDVDDVKDNNVTSIGNVNKDVVMSSGTRD